MTTMFLFVQIPAVLVMALMLLVLLALAGPLLFGSVLTAERQVGIVVKRWGGRSLEPGRLIALNGEAGYQAETLAPGLHFGLWRWQYRIIKVPVAIVPQGEIVMEAHPQQMRGRERVDLPCILAEDSVALFAVHQPPPGTDPNPGFGLTTTSLMCADTTDP